MTLENEISLARTDISADGYEMSIGEVLNLYRDQEISINPAYQRLFRWDVTRKTRFIESLLLGIPIPPIFVYQTESGVWELIDGLQRLSTLFEFAGVLRNEDGNLVAPTVLEGTHYLPSLSGKRWEPSVEDGDDGIGQAQQIQIKRARLRVEILRQESDPKAKYELFQRLNTGGVELSEQEVRNCVAVMVNNTFHEWLMKCSLNVDFQDTIDQTETALEKQAGTELALRFFAFRTVPYNSRMDVHEYLHSAMMELATMDNFPSDLEEGIFRRTFRRLKSALGSRAFKRWDGAEFKGKFLMSAYEVVATGVSKNIDAIEDLPDPNDFILARAQDLWDDPTFSHNSGAGVRGTTRLANLLPMAETFFKPPA